VTGIFLSFWIHRRHHILGEIEREDGIKNRTALPKAAIAAALLDLESVNRIVLGLI
jgi:hypothetical protein